MKQVLAVLMTFLPPRYRAEGARLRSHAMVAAIVQMGAAMGYLVYRFYIFSWIRAGIIDGPGFYSPTNIWDVNGRKGGGILMMAEFLFDPLNVFLLYLFLEGHIRYWAARISNQIIGTLPLYPISAIHGLFDKAKYRRYVGPLVADEVVGGGSGYDLKVYSCRAKLHWNPYMAIEFEGQFFQKFKEEYGAPPRRFIYYLRKSKPGHVAAVVDRYQIDSVLKLEPKKWAGTPTLLDAALPERKLPPLVRDEIVRSVGARLDYDVKVYSCRPKKNWNKHVTIELEGKWYQLIRDEPGSNPRPYVYYLRMASPTHSAAVIRQYTPDDVLRE